MEEGSSVQIKTHRYRVVLGNGSNPISFPGVPVLLSPMMLWWSSDIDGPGTRRAFSEKGSVVGSRENWSVSLEF